MTDMRKRDRPQDILGYWRAVELFTPQSVPDIDRHSPIRQTHLLSDGLPWGPEAVPRSIRIPTKHAVRHAVYFGVYSVQSAYQVLDQAFDPDTEGLDSRPAGSSACAALLVDNDGFASLGTLAVSGCAWAVSAVDRCHSRDELLALAWIDEYERAVADLAELFSSQLSRAASEAGSDSGDVPLTPELIDGLCELTGELLGLHNDTLPHREVRIESFTVPLTSLDQDRHELLNSFFVRDLGLVRDAAARGDIGLGLQHYLSAGTCPPASRIDVRTDLGDVFTAVRPERVPLGRWPSPPTQPAALSQQLAINTLRLRLTDGAGIFSVNGPPGTGKTTLLRDVIASVVVDRADALSALAQPSDAFGTPLEWKRPDGRTQFVRPLIKPLTGHEIVIASSNNAAVQNVTEEIPGVDAVDQSMLGDLDHFREIATSLLNRSDVVDENTRPAWGLIAARLGNKDNRTKFLTYFLFDSKSNNFGERGARDRLGINTLLKQMAKRTSGSWADAVAEYREARTKVERLRDDRRGAADLAAELISLPAELARMSEELRQLRTRNEGMRPKIQELRVELTSLDVYCEGCRRQVQAHRDLRPGRLVRAFKKKARIAWETELGELLARQDLAEVRISATADRLLELSAELTRESSLEQQITNSRGRVDEIERELQRYRRTWNHFTADESWWHDIRRRETASLWLDEEFCAARSALFVAALRLHHHFMRFASAELRTSLFAAADILSNKAPATVPRHKALAVWQTLFLFVPVVSTTFASFDRMFVHLGRQDIGWLLIDEAGQAAPQAAAGAIWRARRSVVVGDPQQLEPVVTIPLHLQGSIRNTFGVSEKWLPAISSAQSLADSANPWGTMLAVGASTLWVGSPLRIHRRCDSPMFEISNAIAYDDMMLSAVSGREELDLPPSMWLNTPGQARGHLVPEQMERLSRILDDLVEKRGCDPTQIFVISPFRVVAQSISRICQPRGISGGTVHTAQGQEADIVIIVLGGDPAKPGAKAWASSKPNLLNVAVSRAKRRLYVIGDRDSWQEFQYFNTLADGLRSN
ncbi:AAA domain-containing protein [Gordonia sp. VNK1]|uniref:DEAD/DEAH box helicase n=1 Tax=Gordonia oleivorans TaxID=3156618 RepID=UPI0032B33D0C